MDVKPRPRVIGRILSLGFPLPGVRVDNYNFLTAPAFFDYDALVVEPLALSALIEGVACGAIEATTFGGAAVRNVPRAPGEMPLADALLRRRAETRALLDRGGAVVAFGAPAVTHHAVAGVDALDSWYWLGGAGPQFVVADGSEAAIVDHGHPLAAFVQSQLANIRYRAAATGAAACVFARSRGGAAIGFELPRERGRVVVLPALKAVPAGDERYRASEVLQAGIRRLLGAQAEGRPPPWTADHVLPGLAEREATVDEARRASEEAARTLAAAESARDELGRYQALLWQEGPGGLDAVVLDALRLIGCDVYDRTPDDLRVRIDGVALLVEIEGDEQAVDLAAHYRLRQRIEDAIARHGESPRGLLFVNGYRLQPPKERPPQASAALRSAAMTMRYAVATTTSLFDAVAAHLAGDGEAVAAYRRRLVTEDGLLA
jgi:hypothetical protein